MDRTHNRKLAIVAPSAYLAGGVQTWLDYVVPGLAARGWSVTVLPVHGRSHYAPKYLELHPFDKVCLVPSNTGSREGRVRALMRALQSTQPDLVLSVNIVDVYEAVARLRKKGLAGLRVAMALHGFNGEFFQDMKTYNRVLDGVITTNRLGIAAAAAIGGVDESRIHYAPCGVEMSDLASFDLTGKTLTLLYAGRFDQREKHVLDLPKILEVLDKQRVPFRLRLAGAGPDEAELRSALSGFGERVEFLGQMDEQTLRTTFYEPGTILLITSPSESGPLVAWEAMSCGTVVVTSRYLGIGLEGSLRDEVNCLVFPVSDTDAAAAAIAKLQNMELLARLARAGHELVRRKYGREISINAWSHTLQKVLERSPQASVENPVRPMPAGRLDRWFGVALAETLRSALRLKYRHMEPGGEWPHSYSRADGQAFLERLHALDRA